MGNLDDEESLDEGVFKGKKSDNTFQEIFDEFKKKKKKGEKLHENYYQYSAYHKMGENKTIKPKEKN